MGLISTCWFIFITFYKPVFLVSMPLLVYLQMAAWLEAHPSTTKGNTEGEAAQATDTGAPTSGRPKAPMFLTLQSESYLGVPSRAPTVAAPGRDYRPHLFSFVRGPLPSTGEQPTAEGPGHHHAPSAPLEWVIWFPSLTVALGCTISTHGLLTLPQSNMG